MKAFVWLIVGLGVLGMAMALCPVQPGYVGTAKITIMPSCAGKPADFMHWSMIFYGQWIYENLSTGDLKEWAGVLRSCFPRYEAPLAKVQKWSALASEAEFSEGYAGVFDNKFKPSCKAKTAFFHKILRY